ncbi:hypothetical protein ACTXGL_01545 [Psychrobacter sp. T6-6]|uniref:hypothetical protein n=1 Tax=Psychrobacter sp. T6-6 TaxID=3457452 RepID=UPI003FD33226
MTQITLDPQADSDDDYVYVIKDNIGMEIKFDADYHEDGERGECWNGQVMVDGDSWIEVDEVRNLQITRVYDPETDDDLALDSTVINDADKAQIIEIIKGVICGYIEPQHKPAYDHYVV